MDYGKMFDALFPGFFKDTGIRSLGTDDVFTELVLDLKAYAPRDPVACPPGILFGEFCGDIAALRAAVGRVNEDWVRYFDVGGRFFTAAEDGRIVSFCVLDEMGRFSGLRVGGPGCVGTVPEYRGRGIGLRLVQLATEKLKSEGFDLSWIHYTHLDKWYASLGYEAVLQWNGEGIVRGMKRERT